MLSISRSRIPKSRLNLYLPCKVSSLIIRHNSTAPKIKPTPALVQRLRKETSCTIQKAIHALTQTANDYSAAIEWLQKDQSTSNQKTLQKLSGRVAGKGLIAISPLSDGKNFNRNGGEQVGNIGIPLRVGMVEVNCETDFVARSEVFEKLCRDLAWAIGFHYSPNSSSETFSYPQKEEKCIDIVNTQAFLGAPMLHEPASQVSPPSLTDAESDIQGAIAHTMSLVGEKITLRRAAVISAPPYPLTLSGFDSPAGNFIPTALSVGIYAHNSTAAVSSRGSSGTIGTAVLTRLRARNLGELALPKEGEDRHKEWKAEYRQLERALARQIVGFPTSGVRSIPGENDGSVAEAGVLPLYKQPFDTYMAIASRNPKYEKVQLDSVESALSGWANASGLDGSVEVIDYLKWSVGGD